MANITKATFSGSIAKLVSNFERRPKSRTKFLSPCGTRRLPVAVTTAVCCFLVVKSMLSTAPIPNRQKVDSFSDVKADDNEILSSLDATSTSTVVGKKDADPSPPSLAISTKHKSNDVGSNSNAAVKMEPAVQHQSEKDDAAADRKRQRHLKFIEKYNYVPPIKSFDAPHKECGMFPDFDDFFLLPASLHSRLLEDQIIYERFFKDKKDPGTYVELGAFDGQTETNTRFFDICLVGHAKLNLHSIDGSVESNHTIAERF